jgi:hypothetical protein
MNITNNSEDVWKVRILGYVGTVGNIGKYWKIE